MTYILACAGVKLGFDPRFDDSNDETFRGLATHFVIAAEPLDAAGVHRLHSPVKNRTALCPICFGTNIERYW
jgi:hypothetical protein